MRKVASGRGGGVIDTITITVVIPLVMSDVGEIAIEGDFDGLPRGSPRTATRKQGGVANDFKTVVGNQSGGDVVLHSWNPLSVEGSCPSLDGLIILQTDKNVNRFLKIFIKFLNTI